MRLLSAARPRFDSRYDLRWTIGWRARDRPKRNGPPGRAGRFREERHCYVVLVWRAESHIWEAFREKASDSAPMHSVLAEWPVMGEEGHTGA